MNLIENNPRNLPNNLTTSIKHTPQNLRRHHQTPSGRINGNISRHKPHISKVRQQLTILLIRKRFDRTGIHDALFVSQTLGNGVFGYNSFTGTGVSCDEDGFVPLDAVDCGLLEGVESEGVGSGRFGGGDVLGDGDIVEVWREGNLVADLITENREEISCGSMTL